MGPSPTEHASLCWTHYRAQPFEAESCQPPSAKFMPIQFVNYYLAESSEKAADTDGAECVKANETAGQVNLAHPQNLWVVSGSGRSPMV
jgi:hypothetical protein